MRRLHTATPPSQRVQFLLGQDDQDEDHMSHDIFCEMEELRAVGEEGDVEWKETARSVGAHVRESHSIGVGT